MFEMFQWNWAQDFVTAWKFVKNESHICSTTHMLEFLEETARENSASPQNKWDELKDASYGLALQEVLGADYLQPPLVLSHSGSNQIRTFAKVLQIFSYSNKKQTFFK